MRVRINIGKRQKLGSLPSVEPEDGSLQNTYRRPCSPAVFLRLEDLDGYASRLLRHRIGTIGLAGAILRKIDTLVHTELLAIIK